MDRVNPQTGFDPANPNIVQVPQFYFILKAAQVGLSILILALSGASIGLLGGYVYYGGPSYSIFVCIATCIITAWYFISTTRSPNLYHKIPVLVLEVFQFLWWLSSWTTLAYWASWASAIDLVWYTDWAGPDAGFLGVLATAAAAAAINWVLFTTTLVVFIIHMRKHGHAAANAHTTIHTTPNKLEMQPQAAPQYPPQQQYAQPQYAAQPQYGAPGQQQYGAPGQPIGTQ